MIINNIFSFLNFFPKSSFQDTATPIMEGIVDLHNHVFFYLIVILISVSFIFAIILLKFYYSIFNPKIISDIITRFYTVKANNVTHGQLLEII
jgi:heme/copper-type cytochrome/quinol oxidase subunit 2